MNEAEIVFQISEVYDRWWVIIQWWVSISFVLLAVSHFAGQKLNYALIAIVLALYSAFSLWMWSLKVFNENISFAFEEDLRSLQSAGDLSTKGASMIIDQDILGRFVVWEDIALFGTFGCVFLYVIYSRLHAGRQSSHPE